MFFQDSNSIMMRSNTSLLCSMVLILVLVQFSIGAPGPDAKASPEPNFYGNGWIVYPRVSAYPSVSLYPIISLYPVNPWNGWGRGWNRREGAREGGLRVYGR